MPTDPKGEQSRHTQANQTPPSSQLRLKTSKSVTTFQLSEPYPGTAAKYSPHPATKHLAPSAEQDIFIF